MIGGHLALASCTRFSPKVRWPAAITGSIACASNVLDTATRVTVARSRRASRQARAISSRTAASPVSAICVLTHDEKFDVPLLRAAVRTPAGYIGAMGSRTATGRRAERLRAEGVTDEELGRIHAPIGLAIGARSPAEVAISIAADLVHTTRRRRPVEENALR